MKAEATSLLFRSSPSCPSPVSLGRAVQRRKDRKGKPAMHHAPTDCDDAADCDEGGRNESKIVTLVHSSLGRSRSGSRRGVSRSRSMQSTTSKSSKKSRTKSALRSQSYISRVHGQGPSRLERQTDIAEMTVRDCAEDFGGIGDRALQCVSAALCLPNDVEVRPISSRGRRTMRSYPHYHSRYHNGRDDEGSVYEDI
eukprot:CAMPEP_0178685732 /NCGR_PEP_ID=MMETSP0699-20121125/3546_1 /TAXON_ID=265572 /ORGANISM="Extubocellulus spinifer, Strain CCMP396" /LENGTH=196 /DNA_ID=CAMNT_0020330517 /DNA_START=119 /DNA_END=709 /DNA_ORIENTATION=+